MCTPSSFKKTRKAFFSHYEITLFCNSDPCKDDCGTRVTGGDRLLFSEVIHYCCKISYSLCLIVGGGISGGVHIFLDFHKMERW